MDVKINVETSDDLETLLERVIQQTIAKMLMLPLDQRRRLFGLPTSKKDMDNEEALPEWDTATRIAQRISALGEKKINGRHLSSARQRNKLHEGKHYRLCNHSIPSTPNGQRFEYSFMACCEYFEIDI